MENNIMQIAQRIKALREILEISREEMALATKVSLEQYIACENGQTDIGISFAHKCANRFGVDIMDLLEGNSPTLSDLSIVRQGKGLTIEKKTGFDFVSLAPLFKNKKAEPFLVRAEFKESEQDLPIKLSVHAGQELDIVKKGALKLQVGQHVEIIREGDVAFFNSETPHGMIAYDGEDCEFYAIVIGDESSRPKALLHDMGATTEKQKIVIPCLDVMGVADRFVDCGTDENGVFNSVVFKNDENFNFAYDIVDEIAKKSPDKLALLHLDKNKNERRFTFGDISRFSNRAANYFLSLGIKKGDRVLLVMKRHYQFWIAMMALNKIGAVAILATNQLLPKDFEYRFQKSGAVAVIATPDDNVPENIESTLERCPDMKIKIIVNAKRDGWYDFDSDMPRFTSHFERQNVGGEDPLLMYFTSGTTGYPKMALHVHKYPLGHYPTARYWHNTDPGGLHLTISDTGWAKSIWGKLYGQWMAESAVFVYDFDRFHADDILPLFAQYKITSFCAPPTMYRMFIKEDLGKYDLSSIKYATIAGEALNPEVAEQFKKHTGVTLMESFGQSETTVVIGNFIGMTPKLGSMGKPSPLYDVDLVDHEGKSVEAGQIGEIVIKTDRGIPNGLFRGYYNDPEKTKEAWHDGMYHMGDTAYRDEDGYYHYVGRVDDLIKSSGYRIGPFEIESVLMELPYILECAITGVPDPIRGQVVKASIVLTKGTEGSDALKKEIQEYVKSHTAPYKYPRIIDFLPELPKTVSGKIKRKDLAAANSTK